MVLEDQQRQDVSHDSSAYLTDEEVSIDCLDRVIDLTNSGTLYVGNFALDKEGKLGSFNVHNRNTWCAECGRSSPYGFDFCVNDHCRCPITMQGANDVIRTTSGKLREANRLKYLKIYAPVREKRGRRSYDPLSNAHVHNYIKRAKKCGYVFGHIHRYDRDDRYRQDMDRNEIPRVLFWKSVDHRTGNVAWERAEQEDYPWDRSLHR